MLILRIRQAEIALKAGRLEETAGLCREERFRSHRRGQKVITRLVERLLQRAREHLAEQHYDLAMVDCERAQQFAGNDPDILDVRTAAATEIAKTVKQKQQTLDAVQAVRRQLDAGRLADGAKLLEAVPADVSVAQHVVRDVAARQALINSALSLARIAADRDDAAGAVRAIVRARQTDRSDRRVNDMSYELATNLRKQAFDAIEAGRPDLLDALVKRLATLEDDSDASRELRHIASDCRAAWADIESGDLQLAAERLRRIRTLCPKAKWIDEALGHVNAIETSRNALRSGPIGLLAQLSGTSAPLKNLEGGSPLPPVSLTPTRNPAADCRLPTQRVAAYDRHSSGLPQRFLLQVDGASAVLVIAKPSVSFGPVSSTAMSDVGLIAEPGSARATIERVDDDYFLRSDGNVFVNDKPTSSKLLATGDRVTLSPRCRFTFATPNPASTSAAVDLTGARYPRGDVRRVILLDHDLVIGPGGAAHVRCDAMATPAVLHFRNGNLFCGSPDPLTINAQPADRAAALPMGQPIAVGGMSFVITAA